MYADKISFFRIKNVRLFGALAALGCPLYPGNSMMKRPDSRNPEKNVVWFHFSDAPETRAFINIWKDKDSTFDAKNPNHPLVFIKRVISQLPVAARFPLPTFIEADERTWLAAVLHALGAYSHLCDPVPNAVVKLWNDPAFNEKEPNSNITYVRAMVENIRLGKRFAVEGTVVVVKRLEGGRSIIKAKKDEGQFGKFNVSESDNDDE
jgi:hypothetical protein